MDPKKQTLIDKHMNDLELVWTMRIVENELRYKPRPKEMFGCHKWLRKALSGMSITELQSWNYQKTASLAIDLMRENKERHEQELLHKAGLGVASLNKQGVQEALPASWT